MDASYSYNSTVTVSVTCEQQIAALNRYLVEKNLDVFGLIRHQNNLEDIFISLTNDNQ